MAVLTLEISKKNFPAIAGWLRGLRLGSWMWPVVVMLSSEVPEHKCPVVPQ
jgi:hypothetical protein